MADKKDDHEFNEYLTGKNRLSQLYQQIPDEQAPSEKVNRTILQAADKAIKNKKMGGSVRTPSIWQQWLLPVSIAAVVLISIPLVFFIDSTKITQTSEQIASVSEDISTNEPASPSPQLANGETEDRANQQLAQGSQQTDKVFSSGKIVGSEIEQAFNDPEAWLEHIDDLIEQNKINRAKESLKRFQKRYPNYNLDKHAEIRKLHEQYPAGRVE